MDIKRGGLAFRNPEKYTSQDNKENYESAMNEMIDKAVKIKCLSYDSLQGFIFEIKVNEADAVFNSLDVNSEFNKPVTTVLLKLIILSDPEKRVEFILDDRTMRKQTMSFTNFNKELEEQFHIYKNSLEYNNIPICPSIIYDNILTDQNKIRKYLTKIYNKIYNITGKKNTLTSEIVQGINQIFVTNKRPNELVSLGIIGMEFADGYTTFNDLLNEISYKGNVKNEILQLRQCEAVCKICASIIVNIIRLFISSGIIHLDLHSKNILINKPLETSTIIDFGIVKKITDVPIFDGDVINVENTIYENPTKKNSLAALNKYLSLILGSSYKYIGNGEQIFMQDYLYDVRDEKERCKKIVKLFLLIIIYERQANYVRVGMPMSLMFDFLSILGLNIETVENRRTMSTVDNFLFNINNLNNKSITLDQWMNNPQNIKPKYKLFFSNIFAQVCETLKNFYKFQDFTLVPQTNTQDAVVRIGLEPEEKNKYDIQTSKYLYNPNKGGYRNKKRNGSRRNKSRKNKSRRRKMTRK